MASNSSKETVEDIVVQQLNELFGSVLNLDIIKTVASSYQYDVTKSSNKLLEITSYSNGKEFINRFEQLTERNDSGNSKAVISQCNLNNVIEPSIKSKKSSDIDRTLSFIKQGYKVLVILRGLPGSGKSTLARQILASTIGYDNNQSMHILNTDSYFCQNKQGIYKYDVAKIGEAHNWNQSRAFQAMSRGFSPVIIDNTNVKMWEMKPYATMATDYGYIIEILEPDTPWCFKEKELSKRNHHFVTKEKIKDMLLSYEKNITPRKLLNDYNLVYKLQKPPQMRLHPPLNVLMTPVISASPNKSLNSQNDLMYSSNEASMLNISLTKKAPLETINLMEFDDDISSNSATPYKINNTIDLCQELNDLDNILMCKDSVNANILKPQQNESTDIVIVDSSSDDEVMSLPKFVDIEKAWGINEKSLRSWDIVTPLTEESNITILNNIIDESKIPTIDMSSITEEKYFRLLKDSNLKNGSSDGVYILQTVNRDINRSCDKQNLLYLKRVNKSSLDKSCMTEDIYEDYDNHMTCLINMFPDVPQNHLKYWYNKWKGDLEWTIEFLLEGKGEISSRDTEDICQKQNENSKQYGVYNEASSDSSNSNEEQKKKRKYTKNSDDYKDIKMAIESKIDINNEHYSKNLLKIKYGSKFVDNYKPSTSSDCSAESKSSCSKELEVVNTNDITNIDLDIEFDNVDLNDNCDDCNLEVEDMIELNLGDKFVMQLEKQFGDPHMSYPKGCQPVVQVPVSLARQLYMFYIESVYQQMDNQIQILETLTKQDEEFARKLQDEEDKGASAHANPIKFSDIMQEQIEQSIYQKEIDKWRELNPDNLAAKLTREKLFRVFPSIDKDTLVEILYAHNNNYRTTVESLLASTGTEKLTDNLETIKQPPIGEDVILEMKNAQKANSMEDYEDLLEATHYREEASKFLRRRDDLYNKAQYYHQKGMKEVAQFYSGLASKQTAYFEKANSLAATAFLDEHAKRLQDFNTLDLHFLYVKEAIIALDMFLDKNINLLRLSVTKHSEYLQIITGRGNRSEKGISKIRPAVQSRLKIRQINFIPMNPGLLKVKILKSSLVTSEVQQ